VNTTDDDKSEVEQDAGAVPAISTNTDEVAGWMNDKERTHSFTGLTGYNTQGMRVYPEDWYMTQRTWDRVDDVVKVPDERTQNKHGDETGSTGDGDL
jgi:hypothetical protein|tara:strand:+ start:685 stop:975 length:291 start_codon:yes stop_codon:yes gene_type:complete